MERVAWKGRILPGKKEEYIKRHNNIWPEMKEVLKEAGISNYTIWTDGDILFGYYECEFGKEFANKVQVDSPIVKKWEEYMKDVLLFEEIDEDAAQPQLEQVFFLE